MTTLFAPTFAPGARMPRAARIALGLLQRLRHGTLHLRLPGGASLQFGSGEPHATLAIHEWSVFDRALAGGDIGFAEAYIDGQWSTPALADLLALLLRNRRELDDAIYGTAWGRLAYRLRHLLNRNTRQGSRRNIEAHYDLGNAFYRLWLDETMNYSAAWFREGTESMADAQRLKVSRALTEAGAQPGARVLEIGCGWGALAEMAVAEFGASIVGVTLSHEQLAHARARLDATGHGAAADLRLQDYRDIADEPFDAICSIEMVEAVGREYWPQYFGTVARLLRPGGRACIQAIVIDDALWDRYVRGTDFIQQHVFPGGCLPCPREFVRHANAAGLEVVNELKFGRDYARTLVEWRQRFTAQQAAVRALGFDERFLRTWEFYLCYCEASFRECSTDVVQYTLRRP
ncbi:SAM-dependent methyltransferase [Ramlibacter albus]|uniref:Class I SAM-dependent methyltransferase n=1 Tax=Ramlibacter albus TaxID=2079448 RepID=A0A923M7N0_9BURK|nr:cyclopropane-fatty-acyl-phospholipid synthase family protein [Ramlibacter albus]MBC5765241.1 class I SAM-dependent methyltransferase [Ramlibacter albus]